MVALCAHLVGSAATQDEVERKPPVELFGRTPAFGSALALVNLPCFCRLSAAGWETL